MSDAQVLDALKDTNERIKGSDPEFDRESPTPFVRRVLGEPSITRPEEFHAHTVAVGEDLPVERPHGVEDPEFFSSRSTGVWSITS